MRRSPVLAVLTVAALLAGCGGDDDSGSSAPEAEATSARSRTQDRAAQSDLRNALVAAKVYYTDEETYADMTASDFEAIEPSLVYDVVANTDEDTVGVGDQTEDQIVLVRRSKSGTFFCIAENISTGTTYGQSDTLADVDTVAECTGPDAWGGGGGGDTDEEDVEEVDFDPADLEAIELGDEPQLDPIENVLNAMIEQDSELYLSAYPEPDCDISSDGVQASLDSSYLDPPYKADVEQTGDDTAVVTVVDGADAESEVGVRRAGDSWVLDLDLCTMLEENAAYGAQSDLRNAFASGKVYYTDTESYTSLTPELLEAIEPSIDFVVIADAAVNAVGVGDVSATQFVLATQADSGTWYCIADDVSVGTTFGSGAELAEVDTVAECSDAAW